jgi:organic hydroperoxide reductase OsmC/OhrA
MIQICSSITQLDNSRINMNAHEYNIGLTWEGGRKGRVSSPEVTEAPFNAEVIEVATPPQFPKGVAGVWSPEHLFTAAVSSCMMTTFLAIAENFKLNFESFSCPAKGKLELVNGSLTMTEVALSPQLTISHADQIDLAKKVLERSERACLISNSIKSRVTVKSNVQVAEFASKL